MKQRSVLQQHPLRARAVRTSTAFLLILAALLGPGFSPPAASAQPLFELSAPLVEVFGAAGGGAAWGDYDKDEDLDLLVSGTNSSGQPATILFRNRGGGRLTAVASGLPNVESSSVDWGDYNHDGYLDVLLTGKTGVAGGQITGHAGVYRSVANYDESIPSRRVFNLAYALPNIYEGDAHWGDFNNDGLLDILLAGYTDGGAPLTRLYRNTGSGFTVEEVSGLVNLGGGAASWGDFDGDSLLDFAVMGRQSDGSPRALVYQAAPGGGFQPPIELTGMWGGALLFFDLENDGRLELLLTGNRGDNNTNILPTTILYRYDGTGFTPVLNSGLPDIWQSALSAGDYDNDGFTDLLLNGMTTSDRPTRIYRNQSGSGFVDSGLALPTGTGISVLWGDFNGDHTLDLALSGVAQDFSTTTQVYLNLDPALAANQPPAAPNLVAACWDGGSRLTLDWSAPNDDHTSGGRGLSYNIRLFSYPWLQDISSPESDLFTGFWRLAQPGRLSYGSRAIFTGLPVNQYYWTIQAVDSALAGSAFSEMRKIYLGYHIAIDDEIVTDEDTPVSFNVLSNDNKELAPLNVYQPSQPQNGTLEGSGGAYTFRPAPNWNGSTSFTYHALGVSSRYCTQATVRITVRAVNDPPSGITLSNNSVLSDLPAGTLVGLLSAADPDPGDTLTLELVAGSHDNSFFQLDGDRLLTSAVFDYAARSQYTINVAARDAAGAQITRLFTIQVEHNTPVSIDCASGCAGFDPASKTLRVTMSEDGAPLPFQLALRGIDQNAGETLTWSLASPPTYGAALVSGATLPGQALAVQYAPDPDWFSDPQEDSFGVRLDDSQGHFDTLTVQVQVAPVNDPPGLDPIPNQVFGANSGAQQVAISGITPGPANEAGQPLTFQVETNRPDLVRDLWVEYPGTGDSATLHLFVEGASGTLQVTVTVSDGQAENALTTRSFSITLLSGQGIYLPLIFGP